MLSYEDGSVMLSAIEIITLLLFWIMKTDSKREKIIRIIVGITIIVISVFQMCLQIQMNKSYLGDMIVIIVWIILVIALIFRLKKDS